MKKEENEFTPFISKGEFICPKCGTVHKLSMYPSAQLAMENDMTFSCTCETKVLLPSSKFKLIHS